MAATAHVPAELIDLILASLRVSAAHHLTACALVCKSWLSLARYHLYRIVDLRGLPDAAHRITRFKHTLESSPFISDLVCEFNIDAGYIGGSGFASALPFRFLRKLLIESVSSEDMKMLADAIQPSLLSLKHLEIDGSSSVSGYDLVQMITAISNIQSLRHLSLSVPIVKEAPSGSYTLTDSSIENSRPRLISLDIGRSSQLMNINHTSSDPLEGLSVPFDLSGLRSFTIDDKPESQTIVSQLWGTLEEFVVVQSLPLLYAHQDIPRSPLVECHSLRHLWIDIPPWIHMEILFQLVCPVLERVTLTCSQAVRDSIYMSLRPQNLSQWKALDERLVDLTRKTQLREVTVAEILKEAHCDAREVAVPPTCERFRRMLPKSSLKKLLHFEVYRTRNEAEAERRLIHK
ncbi:hypothetical protein PM082_001787 [Marasmius tenuissimus]|nr:hypothetical protein PM082_001787 [Marasmius tenuissimus]